MLHIASPQKGSYMSQLALHEIECDIWRLVRLVCKETDIDTIKIQNVVDCCFGKLLVLDLNFLTAEEYKKVCDIREILDILWGLILERELLKKEITQSHQCNTNVSHRRFANRPTFFGFDIISQTAKRQYTKLTMQQKHELEKWLRDTTGTSCIGTNLFEQVSKLTGLSIKTIKNWYVYIERRIVNPPTNAQAPESQTVH